MRRRLTSTTPAQKGGMPASGPTPPPPGMAETYCPKCGELLTPLLQDLAIQRLIAHPGQPHFGIACTGCMERLVTTGLPFASVLNVVASSTETIQQANAVLDAVHQARIRRKG